MDANGRKYLAGEPKVLEYAGPAALFGAAYAFKAAQNRRTPKRKRVSPNGETFWKSI
jgi:hypothetical protein